MVKHNGKRERERVILRRRRGLVPATRTTRSKNARRARRTSGMLVHTAVPPLASVPAILVQGGGGVLRQNSGGLAVKERLKTQFCLAVCAFARMCYKILGRYTRLLLGMLGLTRRGRSSSFLEARKGRNKLIQGKLVRSRHLFLSVCLSSLSLCMWESPSRRLVPTDAFASVRM